MTALVAGALAGPHEALAPKAAIGAFVLFCRIGACLMLAPGFSNAQIPAQVRLFVALAVTLTLTPLLLERVPGAVFGDDPIFTLKVIAVESLVGGMIGFLARVFYLALEALAVGAATMLGFSNPFGFQVEGDEAMAPLATLISLAAIALLFAADLHWELLRGLVASYDVIPVGADFNARLALKQIADALGESFRLSLRIASPYVIYALVVNLALALVNRLTPQVQVFFVAMPFVAAGGLLLLYFTIKPAIDALTRIGRFQALMRDLGRSKLHSLERQQAGLTDDLKAVFQTLESDELAYGPQAGLAARHIRALQRKLDQLVHDQDAARLSALAQGTRAKLAELALEAAALDHRRNKERKELAELIERAIARRAASST
jgi:flagellar biosynthetic protein FliR